MSARWCFFVPPPSKDHQPVAVTPEIDAITWAEIDLVFQNAATHGFDGREIAIGDSFQGRCDLRRGVHVEAAQPLREGAFSRAVNIFANVDQQLY